MAEKTLNDVVQVLQDLREESTHQREGIKTLSDSVTKFVQSFEKKQESDRLKNEEERRERKKQQRQGSGFSLGDSFRAGLAAGGAFNLTQMLSPRAIAGILAAGGIAGSAAFAGVRTLPPAIVDWTVGRVYKLLGMTEDGKFPKVDAETRVPVMTRIMTSMRNLEFRILKMFGINPRGTQLRDARGRFTGQFSRVPVVDRVSNTIGKLLTPVIKLFQGIEQYILGPGAKVFSFMAKTLGITALASGVGGVVKLAGKILWPVSILIAAYDGVTSFMDTEGSIWDKWAAGIGGFLGDLIGAPLDLIKRLVTWGIEKMTGVDLRSAIGDFSFEDLISDFFSAIPRKFLELRQWVSENLTIENAKETILLYGGLLIDIPVKAFRNTYNIVKDAFGNITDSLLNTVDRTKILFMRFGTMLQNIPDKLVSAITGILDFELPKLSIPYRLPFGDPQELVLFEGGKIFGDVSRIREQAASRVETRDADLETRTRRLENAIAARLEEGRSALDTGRSGAPVIVQTDSRTSNQSNVENNTIITQPSTMDPLVPIP